MATGTEHYAEAEKLLVWSPDGVYGEEFDRARAALVAEAQVHATLALADHVAALVDRLGEVPR